MLKLTIIIVHQQSSQSRFHILLIMIALIVERVETVEGVVAKEEVVAVMEDLEVMEDLVVMRELVEVEGQRLI